MSCTGGGEKGEITEVWGEVLKLLLQIQVVAGHLAGAAHDDMHQTIFCS